MLLTMLRNHDNENENKLAMQHDARTFPSISVVSVPVRTPILLHYFHTNAAMTPFYSLIFLFVLVPLRTYIRLHYFHTNTAAVPVHPLALVPVCNQSHFIIFIPIQQWRPYNPLPFCCPVTCVTIKCDVNRNLLPVSSLKKPFNVRR